MSIDFSIIICTYNRAHSLEDTLRAVRALEVAEAREWEVIVVDNNSSDETRQQVSRLQENWDRLRYEFEPTQGLSYARNRGVACARGEILLFTDDDVLPEPDWVEQTLLGLERHHADACGGFIAPLWETPPPAWLTQRFHGFLAIRDEREDDYPIEHSSDAPYGANMAVKRHVFERVGHFDTSRGRKGSVLASGEDGELFERILGAGYKAVFLGSARVHHKVESFRVRKQYFRRWRYQTSRNLALVRDVPGGNRLLNIPLYLFPQFLRALARAVWSRFTQPADDAFNREVVVFHFLGTFSGLISSRQQRSSQAR